MTDYVITVFRSETPPEEYCESDEGFPAMYPEGEWYFNLGDGHLPVGQFRTAEVAEAAARIAIAHYHEMMGGVMGLVTCKRDG